MSSTAESDAQTMQSRHRLQSGRQRLLVLLAITGFAATSLASIYTLGPTLSSINDDHKSVIDSQSSRRLQTALGMYIDPKSVDIKQYSKDLQHSNNNNNNMVTSDNMENNPISPTTITTYTHLIHNEIELPKYTLQQVIEEAATMRSKYAILRYDPTTDKFTGYYSKYERWVPGCYKLMHSLSALTVLLRTIFPERFTRKSPEFIMGVSSGDYPAMVDQQCIYRDQDVPCDDDGSGLNNKAPVLHFGSVFRKAMFPNMVAMPMPGEHLDCFVSWSLSKEVCAQFQPKQVIGTTGLVFGDGLSYDDLTPQVIWRGTDFPFLNLQNSLDQPDFEDYVESNIDPNGSNPLVDAIAVMRENYSRLVPRWQGVVLTAEAEQEALETKSLPKVNIKFSSARGKGKPAAVGNPKYKHWEDIGFPLAGNGMPPEEMSKFKYHIDIGGGGGTTWTGTTDKLAMPGLLFHHITPTKDYIHDHLLPWEHYVPIQADLSDLREKIEWAETHPDEARKIAGSATEFMRQMGTPEGYENLFIEDVVKPLKAVIDAYVPGTQGDWEKKFKKTFVSFIDCPNPFGKQNGFGLFRWQKRMNHICKKWEPKLA
mmetsp:Transcript_11182/g.17063  ORF Transcript_11182/g.17063 Transcript_11182/m.17063 type:complete len:595 (-) Transcript_11182:754-2538(-)